MNISKIAEISAQVPASTPKTAVEQTERKNSTLATDNADSYVKSTSTYTPAYTKGTTGKENVVDRAIFSKSNLTLKNESMRAMAQNTIMQQAGGKPTAPLSLDALVQSAYGAAEATSKGTKDYWGAEATSERIFTFAKTLAGDDSKMLDKMKKAFQKGFGMAEGGFGKGKLPGVSYDTYDRVMNKFSDLESQLNKGTANETVPSEPVKPGAKN